MVSREAAPLGGAHAEEAAEGVATARVRCALLVDAHVHLHPCFDRARFFECAVANVRRAGQRARPGEFAAGCLLLAETPGTGAFESLRDLAPGGPAPGWRTERSADDLSILMTAPGGETVIVVAGWQVRTRERLEVLALGMREPVPEGLAVTDAIDSALAAGGIAVVPWGFGKWWFERGKRVAELLEAPPPGFFLGDNGGRPPLLGKTKLFEKGRSAGVLTLPGSDPLPFERQVCVAGRHGSILDADLSAARAGQEVIGMLRTLEVQPPTYGARERFGRFARNQVAMQIKGLRGW